ncbi:protein roadkill-like [Musca vetustissima]|uniref:protein roadkill-like n=1 Tax=Musca vetustissima TaxID=27455 RepID=UPI002AB706B6|nr:protein roadkill-like [Musca vetustissima]
MLISCNIQDTIFYATLCYDEDQANEKISTIGQKYIACFKRSYPPVDVRLEVQCESATQFKFESNKQALTDISMDFANILASKEFSDVTLVAQDRFEFKAHKVVLCARSEVFAAMFRNDLQEKLTGSITIDDMDSDVLKELLNYIYTDEEIPKEMAADLFVAANKYALSALQKMCEDFLIEAMSADTVVDILLLGDRHASERLKSKAVQFAIENIKTVSATESWKILREIEFELCMDILEKAMQGRI